MSFYRQINKAIRKFTIAISVTIGDYFRVPIVNRIELVQMQEHLFHHELI